VTDRTDRAFTLIEVLLATALLALLLSAVAVAMHASMQSYTENEHLTALTQAARSVLSRMMRDVRTADAVDSTSTTLTILPPADGSGVTQVQYAWTGGSLTYSQTTGAGTTTEVLLGGNAAVSAQAFAVARETGVADGLTYTKTVTAAITFASGGRTFTVTASADVRRNQQY
jgi:prepilin-type N-terminal cleavage/methylation domain-containing protein